MRDIVLKHSVSYGFFLKTTHLNYLETYIHGYLNHSWGTLNKQRKKEKS